MEFLMCVLRFHCACVGFDPDEQDDEDIGWVCKACSEGKSVFYYFSARKTGHEFGVRYDSITSSILYKMMSFYNSIKKEPFDMYIT
jgi:hypothetical protein